MLAQKYQSIDDVQQAILSHLLREGIETSPRGVATIESEALSFTLLNPRRRCVLNSARRWSLPLALGELCWHLSSATNASALTYYAMAWKTFADSDGQIRGSCYGSKIFNTNGESPWTRVRNLLGADRDTRRAVLYFNDTLSHLAVDCRDAACASSLQFLIRGGALDAVACMRSNDVIWGLPYDVFLFTFLQEMMATTLGVEVGVYHHFAASAHLYSKKRDLASRVLACTTSSEFAMPPLKAVNQVGSFLEFEQRIRLYDEAPRAEGLSDYWEDLVQVLLLFRTSKKIGWQSALASTAPTLRYLSVLEPLMQNSVATVHTEFARV
jgi:thymidylate synthase